MIDAIMAQAGSSMQAGKSFDLSPTAMIALIALVTLEAFVSEAFLVSTLWPARALPSLSLYMLPIVHLLPWLAGMQWLWKIRRAARNGDLNAIGVSTSYSAILFVLIVTYVALTSVEIAFGSAWRSGSTIF
jgi:hypothetical protein